MYVSKNKFTHFLMEIVKINSCQLKDYKINRSKEDTAN